MTGVLPNALWRPMRVLLFRAAEADGAEAGVEARQAAAAIQQLLRTAGPGRMGVGIDVEVQRRPFGPVGRAREEFLAIGHDDLDHVVMGVDVGLHVMSLQSGLEPLDGQRLARWRLL